MVGKRFGRWLVVELHHKQHYTNGTGMYWLCRCDCGVEKAVNGFALRRGETRSCGCWNLELVRQRSITHGMSRQRFYNIWCSMHGRCNSPSFTGYGNYGGRGIRVCKRWRKFEAFRDDMLPTYQAHLSIERRANEGHYSPANCYWATRVEQMNNTRRNHLLTLNGRTMTCAQWCRELGIPPQTLNNRLHKHRWPVEKALLTPLRVVKRRLVQL